MLHHCMAVTHTHEPTRVDGRRQSGRARRASRLLVSILQSPAAPAARAVNASGGPRAYLARARSCHPLPRARLQAALLGIVGASARGQSLKGLLTAGPTKSAVYAAAKIAKSVRGFLRG